MTSKGSASVGIALEVPEKKSEINEGSSEPTDIQRSSVAAGESGTAKMVDSSFNDCEKGEAEAKVAESSESLIDKLFYLRRAQRFCPNEPKWYVELGKIYTSLGRSEDAKTQYEDALQLRSDYAPAKEGLKDLEEAVY
jgi:tetratricopeptide (TPR) repeat protein